MATSKTLTPTNVTIQIPEFTDQPDQRVNSNCIDKLGDAVNTLNTKTTVGATLIDTLTFTADGSKTLDCSNYRYVLINVIGNASNYRSFLFPVTSVNISIYVDITATSAIYDRGLFTFNFTNNTCALSGFEHGTWSSISVSVYGVQPK